MKTIIALIITAILGFATQQASAQLDNLLQPFNAKAGYTLALKSADSSMTGAKLLGVLTLGDTTSDLSLPVKITFDMTNGQSKGWLYFMSGKSRSTSADTLISVGIVKVILFGLQVLPFDTSPLGPLSLFFGSSLPDNWLDSGDMAAKIRADATYKAFAAKYPEKKPLLVPLSVAISPQFFSGGTPLWQLTFGGSLLISGAPGTLECEVHAISGEVKCQDNPATSVEDIAADNRFSLAPNPASDAVRFAMPDGLRGGIMSVTVVNTVGQVVFSNNLETSGAESVVVPVTTMTDGVYRLICSATGRTMGATFVVAR